MLIPSFKEIILFITLNICIIIFFNIILFNNAVLLTYERNNTILIEDHYKIVKLVSVFILTVFILNILIFKFLLRIGNQPIYTSIKISIGVILVGILLTVGIEMLYNLN